MNRPHFTEQLNMYAKNIKVYKTLLGYYNEKPMSIQQIHEDFKFFNDEIEKDHFQHGSEQHGDFLATINKDLIKSIRLERYAKISAATKNAFYAIGAVVVGGAALLYIIERLF